jgi:hypothetical protein
MDAAGNVWRSAKWAIKHSRMRTCAEAVWELRARVDRKHSLNQHPSTTSRLTKYHMLYLAYGPRTFQISSSVRKICCATSQLPWTHVSYIKLAQRHFWRNSLVQQTVIQQRRQLQVQSIRRANSARQGLGGTLIFVLGVCSGALLISLIYSHATPLPHTTDPFLSSTTHLPKTPSYTKMPVPFGHLGNLNADQEAKLRSFWVAILKTFGVPNPNLANGATPDSQAASAKATSPKVDKKKKRMSIFSRKYDENIPLSEEEGSTELSAADDDKYGQVKEFHSILEKQSPEELCTAFWTMVKSDHPDALLLRFLRARKWDVDKALVMLVSTLHWRSAEMHVDDDVIKHGEGGALEDSKSKDPARKKEGDDFLQQLKIGKSFLHGTDKEGRPLCIVRVRLHHPGEQSERSMERYTVYIIETARLALRPPVETAVSVNYQQSRA